MITSLLRTRRWIAFTVVVILAIVAFGLLSTWQWSRAQDRSTERSAVQARVTAPPIAWPPSSVSTAPPEWSTVALEGTYLAGTQALVRKRSFQSRNGFWVMTPLSTDSGVVWVNRGWLPASGDAASTPAIPAPPSGPVTMTGYLRAFSDPDPSRAEGLPRDQVADPDIAQLPDVAARPDGYVQAADSQPPSSDLAVLPTPEIDDGRNISYAVQWALFAVVALGGWFFFLRREAREDAARQSGATAGSKAELSASVSRGSSVSRGGPDSHGDDA